MPVCEICENNSIEVFECKKCGVKFCSKCGDSERDICEDCLDYENAYHSGMSGDEESSD